MFGAYSALCMLAIWLFGLMLSRALSPLMGL